MHTINNTTLLQQHLIIFTRYPESGKTKTRLIPALGDKEAAEVHRKMTERTISTATQCATTVPLSVEICYEGSNEKSMIEWLGSGLHYTAQRGDDLGERMKNAFEVAFHDGADNVVLIGTDCPALTSQILLASFESLHTHDLVLGPAKDGGYYLIGMNRPIPQLFESVEWGTEKVLQQTRTIADRLNLSVGLVDVLDDVDRPEDLRVWNEVIAEEQNVETQRISIVIPTLNEASTIAKTISYCKRGANIRIIVVDGGSDDGTAQIAHHEGAKVYITEPGRARQMNYGADRAEGDILLFLHADTLLPEDYDRRIRRIMSKSGVAAGAFTLHIETSSGLLRFIQHTINFRARLFQMPYGDHGIFIKKSLFQKMGGFSEMPIMEDFEMMRRLRRKGKIVIDPAHVTTSTRRWENLGILRTTFINKIVLLGYKFGVAPEKLSRLYRGTRNKEIKR